MNTQLLHGDCRQVLKTLPDESVNCCVTSPPYFGLRDYGVSGQIGLEQTPYAYVAELVAVFREVKRVLRPDGCVFLNLGDSYYSSNGSSSGRCSPKSTLTGCGGKYRKGSKNEAMFENSSLTSSRNYAILRENLTEDEYYEVAVGIRRHMPKLWESCWKTPVQGAVREVLQGEIQEGTPGENEGIRESVLSPESEKVYGQDKGQVDREKESGNSTDGREVRLLRRNGEDVSLSGSYQGKRETGLSETWRSSRCLEESDCGRIAERQIPASLLELQFGIRFIRFLSSLKLDVSDIPQPLKIYFRISSGLKPKDLIGIPWLVAFALRADGWYLRQDIIWNKPNPMPESVTDRCTKAHEYVFLLSKSERYYYDAEAIKEAAISGDPRKPYAPGQVDKRGDGHARGGGKVRESVKRGGFNGKTESMEGRNTFRAIEDWRNKRSVWTVSTKPYKEAHFATFPTALITPMILAGCPSGGTVLDPFGGSGTTGEVAESLGRNSILIELNPAYIEIQGRRTAQMGMAV